jgi:hypothetical protein
MKPIKAWAACDIRQNIWYVSGSNNQSEAKTLAARMVNSRWHDLELKGWTIRPVTITEGHGDG